MYAQKKILVGIAHRVEIFKFIVYNILFDSTNKY